MQVYFISDLHLGHKNVLEHTSKVPGAYRGGSNVAEHDQWVIERCLSVKPTKRSLWYILGDVAMTLESLALIGHLPGRKKLVLGNHDLFPTSAYLAYFEQVLGGLKLYDLWITHIPVHPSELCGRCNVHGHSHRNDVVEQRQCYLNTAIEWLPNNAPLTLDQVRAHFIGIKPPT